MSVHMTWYNCSTGEKCSTADNIPVILHTTIMFIAKMVSTGHDDK